MISSSTPFENVLGLLGSSEAWKKYFPGIQSGRLDTVYQEPSKEKMPELKGIDFSTGKSVDLGKYWGGQSLDVSNFFNPQEGEPASNAINPPSYETPASPLTVEDINRILKEKQEQTAQTRREEMAYNMGMIPILQQSLIGTADWARRTDLQNTLAAKAALQNMPESYAYRSNLFQQGAGLASNAFGTELGAVSDAASRARRDAADAIIGGKGFGRA
jgi:hypothetical protein